jgi:hypothetical protein
MLRSDRFRSTAHRAFFDDAIITTGMSEGGDSGPLLMDNALNGIGILFGGLVTGSTTAVSWFNPLQVILNNVGVSLVNRSAGREAPVRLGQAKTMRKADFELGEAAMSGASERDIEAAKLIMRKHRSILQAEGISGIWIGPRLSKPYIMVSVSPSGSGRLKRQIPDSLDGLAVYYIEGVPTLGHH